MIYSSPSSKILKGTFSSVVGTRNGNFDIILPATNTIYIQKKTISKVTAIYRRGLADLDIKCWYSGVPPFDRALWGVARAYLGLAESN